MRREHPYPLFDGINQSQVAQDTRLGSKVSAKKQYVSSIWSFPNPRAEHLIRWYGTLPRALVERLLILYAVDSGARVLDPFVGTGTTLDVAADAHLHATGIDRNPLACLTAEVLLSGAPPRAVVLEATSDIYRKLHLCQQTTKATETDILIWDDRYAYTRKWFRPETLNATLKLLLEIAEVDDLQTQRLLFLAAAQVIRRVASVDARCTHHLVTKRKPFIDPLPLWKAKVFDSLNILRSVPADPTLVSVEQGSALELAYGDSSFDFVLIHPPYLGMIHYHLLHRLATDILEVVKMAKSPVSLVKYDFDYASLREADVSTDGSKRYQKFIESLALVMRRIVAPGGRCAIIIGDQRYDGHIRHPFTEFIRCFESCGFVLEENFIWILQNNAGMHILRRGHFIDHNYILIFNNRIVSQTDTKWQK